MENMKLCYDLDDILEKPYFNASMHLERSMAEGNAASILASLNDFVEQKGWKVLQHREINYGIQAIVADGAIHLPVNIYNTGRVVVQGKKLRGQESPRRMGWPDTGSYANL